MERLKRTNFKNLGSTIDLVRIYAKLNKFGSLEIFFSFSTLKVLENALYNGVKISTGEDLDEILKVDELPTGCAEYLAEWLFLIEKLIDTGRILENRYALPSKYAPEHFHVPFFPGRYLVTLHQIAFRAVKKLWGKKALKGYTPKQNSPKLLETLLAVLRHIINSEDQIKAQTEKEDKEDNQTTDKLTEALNKYWNQQKNKPLLESFESGSGSNFAERIRQHMRNYPSEQLTENFLSIMEDAARSTSNENLQTQLNRIQNELLEVSSSSTAALNTARRPVEPPRVENLQQQRQQAQDLQRENALSSLEAMGYPRPLALRALELCGNSLPQAVDYCLNHAEDDDDELEQAIAMSLMNDEEEQGEGLSFSLINSFFNFFTLRLFNLTLMSIPSLIVIFEL